MCIFLHVVLTVAPQFLEVMVTLIYCAVNDIGKVEPRGLSFLRGALSSCFLCVQDNGSSQRLCCCAAAAGLYEEDCGGDTANFFAFLAGMHASAVGRPSQLSCSFGSLDTPNNLHCNNVVVRAIFCGMLMTRGITSNFPQSSSQLFTGRLLCLSVPNFFVLRSLRLTCWAALISASYTGNPAAWRFRL